MALIGKAAVVLWTTMQDREAHDDWHSHEHLPERVGIDGFLRGRRCAALDATLAHYFVIYEVEDLDVMTSPGYLARLNNPSAWTERTMTRVLNVNRTLCEVAITAGAGMGSEVLTVRLSALPGHEDVLTQFLSENLPDVGVRPGLVGAHLLKKSETVRPDTKERELRQKPDDSEDWVLILEAYDGLALDDLANDVFSPAALIEAGAAPTPLVDRYRLAHLLEDSEMKRSNR